MRCAETTCASKGMANSARMSEAAFIVSQSLADPMTTPTTGEALFKKSLPGKTPDFSPGHPRASNDRHHTREFGERPASGLDGAAGAAGHLGTVVRSLPHAGPAARTPRDSLRGALQARQAEQRRAARHR